MDEQNVEVKETNETAKVTEQKPKKERAPRRTPVLVVGRWLETDKFDGTSEQPVGKGRVFHPSVHQPTGEASKEVESLARWLRDDKNIERLMAEGLTDVEVVRQELITATLGEVKVRKASVKR